MLICLFSLLWLVGCESNSNVDEPEPAEIIPIPLGGSATPTSPNDDLVTLPPVDPLSVSGNVIAAGSSTVFPLAERMAERFYSDGFLGNVTVESIGSGAGFSRFCETGETDIVTASRPINEAELALCRSIGREPLEFRVGTDALAIIVNRQNDFVHDVTLDELAQIFSTARLWSDVRPEWPAMQILRYVPGTDSGTFEYFVEEIFAAEPAPLLTAANLEQSEDDNVLAQGVLGSPYAVGFFGYAFYEESRGQLRTVAIDGIEPSPAAVDTGAYPLARPLSLYTTAGIMQQKPQVAAFINYFLTHVNEEILDVGYFPAGDAVLNAARQRWLEAIGS